MALVRFHSRHLCVQHYMLGIKVFPPYPKCNVTHAASKHILTCIGCQKNEVFSSFEEVFAKLKKHEFMDLFWMLLSSKWDKQQ